MRFHAAVAAAVLAAVAVAPAADAAPKKKPKPKPLPPPACNLVTDPAGDVSNTLVAVDAFPKDDGLDLLGADVVSDAKNITAVIRLAANPGTADDARVYAKRYILQMNVDGLKNPLLLAAAISPTGIVYSYGFYGPNPTTGNVGFNYSGTPAVGKINEKVITVGTSLANIAAMEQLGPIKPNAKISGLSLTANRRVPSLTQVTGQVMVADEAAGKTPYYAGSRSCVTTYAG